MNKHGKSFGDNDLDYDKESSQIFDHNQELKGDEESHSNGEKHIFILVYIVKRFITVKY